MSVQVSQIPTTITTIYPIVLNSSDAILGYQTASAIAINSDVNAGFTMWSPSVSSFYYVYDVSQTMYYNGVQNQTVKNINSQ